MGMVDIVIYFGIVKVLWLVMVNCCTALLNVKFIVLMMFYCRQASRKVG